MSSVWQFLKNFYPGLFEKDICVFGWIESLHTHTHTISKIIGKHLDGWMIAKSYTNQPPHTNANKLWMRGEWRYDNLITFTQRFTLHYKLMEEKENR